MGRLHPPVIISSYIISGFLLKLKKPPDFGLDTLTKKDYYIDNLYIDSLYIA